MLLCQALSLLINLTEMCSNNRTLLETITVPWIESDLSESEDVIPKSENVCSNNSSMKLLVQLFLERFSKAESTQIQVLRNTCSSYRRLWLLSACAYKHKW